MHEVAGPQARKSFSRLWYGGLAAAVVAALVAIAGFLIINGILGIDVLAPTDTAPADTAGIAGYAVASAIAALLATALLQLLILAGTPRRRVFFSSIMLLLTLIVVVLPLSAKADTDGRIATAVLNLAIGLAITATLSAVAQRD